MYFNCYLRSNVCIWRLWFLICRQSRFVLFIWRRRYSSKHQRWSYPQPRKSRDSLWHTHCIVLINLEYIKKIAFSWISMQNIAEDERDSSLLITMISFFHPNKKKMLGFRLMCWGLKAINSPLIQTHLSKNLESPIIRGIPRRATKKYICTHNELYTRSKQQQKHERWTKKMT